MVSHSLDNLPVLDDSTRHLDEIFVYGHGLVVPDHVSINPFVIISNEHKRSYRAPKDLEPFITGFVNNHIGESPLVACVHYHFVDSLNVAKFISSRNVNYFPDNLKSTYQQADEKARWSTAVAVNLLLNNDIPLKVGYYKLDEIDVLMMIQ